MRDHEVGIRLYTVHPANTYGEQILAKVTMSFFSESSPQWPGEESKRNARQGP